MPAAPSPRALAPKLEGPRFAEWLATFRCNLRCKHCAAEAGPARPGELGTAESLSLLDDLAALGVEHLCISGGELTMRDDWKVVVEHALRRFSAVHLISNGRLGRSLVDALVELRGHEKLTLMLSIDGDEVAHDDRRGRGSFRKAVEALDAARAFRAEVITTVSRDNVEDLGRVRALCLDHGASGWVVQPAVPLGRQEAEGSLGVEGIALVARFVLAQQAALGSRLLITTTTAVRSSHAMRAAGAWTGCPAASEQVVVLPDGSVTGCLLLEGMTCGSVKELGVAEIWRGEAMASMRRLVAAPCPDCDGGAGSGEPGCVAAQRIFGRHVCT